MTHLACMQIAGAQQAARAVRELHQRRDGHLCGRHRRAPDAGGGAPLRACNAAACTRRLTRGAAQAHEAGYTQYDAEDQAVRVRRRSACVQPPRRADTCRVTPRSSTRTCCKRWSWRTRLKRGAAASWMARAKGGGSPSRSGEMRWTRGGLTMTSFGARFSALTSEVGGSLVRASTDRRPGVQGPSTARSRSRKRAPLHVACQALRQAQRRSAPRPAPLVGGAPQATAVLAMQAHARRAAQQALRLAAWTPAGCVAAARALRVPAPRSLAAATPNLTAPRIALCRPQECRPARLVVCVLRRGLHAGCAQPEQLCRRSAAAAAASAGALVCFCAAAGAARVGRAADGGAQAQGDAVAQGQAHRGQAPAVCADGVALPRVQPRQGWPAPALPALHPQRHARGAGDAGRLMSYARATSVVLKQAFKSFVFERAAQQLFSCKGHSPRCYKFNTWRIQRRMRAYGTACALPARGGPARAQEAKVRERDLAVQRYSEPGWQGLRAQGRRPQQPTRGAPQGRAHVGRRPRRRQVCGAGTPASGAARYRYGRCAGSATRARPLSARRSTSCAAAAATPAQSLLLLLLRPLLPPRP